MRLVKFVQIGLGMAATGTAVVVLGGSALAAESGLGSATQTPFEQGASQPVSQTSISQTVDSNSTASVTVTQTQTTGAVGNDNGSPKPSEQTQGQAASSSDGDGQPPVTQTGDETPVQQTAAAKEGNTSLTTNSKDEGAQGAVLKDSDEAAMSAPMTETGVPVVVYRSVRLPIQPTIMGASSQRSGDLAASLPSVPVSDRTPVPAKTNGWLGNLSAVMAGTVVPQPFVPQALPLDRVTLAMGLLLVAFLLGAVYLSNYGLWLRRGGFATAARSDGPTASHFIPFATPLLLGYVPALQRPHSPIFMGVENRFLMLSERRKCI